MKKETEKSGFDTFKDECERLIFEMYGIPVDELQYDYESLVRDYKDGTQPIDIALAFKIVDYD